MSIASAPDKWALYDDEESLDLVERVPVARSNYEFRGPTRRGRKHTEKGKAFIRDLREKK